MNTLLTRPRQQAPRAGENIMEALEQRLALSTTPDDRFEPNHPPAEVINAPEGVAASPNLGVISGQRTIRNLASCGNVDLFRIRLQGAGTSTNFARINFNQSLGDLDLQLMNANGRRVLRASNTTSSPERISFEGLAAGTYMLRIKGKNGATNPNYRLTINAPSASNNNPTDDNYENNDSLADASAATAGAANSPNLGPVTATRTISSLKLADTYDVFKFSITSTVGASTPKFVRIDSTSPLNMVLFNAAGTSIRSASAYLGQNSVDLTELDAGEYFVQITHYALTAGTYNYNLNITL